MQNLIPVLPNHNIVNSDECAQEQQWYQCASKISVPFRTKIIYSIGIHANDCFNSTVDGVWGISVELREVDGF
jgi:hypothetical protein